MSRELRICPGVGNRKCGAFLSTLDRDPHPTCTRCRGRICTRDMTCDICADWSAAQWQLFVKKRFYKEWKKTSRPSGSVPPALLTSPRAETPSGVSEPGTSSSSFSRPSGGQDKTGGGGGGVSQGAPGVVSREASSPPAGSRSNEREGVGSVSRQSSVARKRAPSSSAPSGGGGGVAWSQRTPHAHSTSSVASPRSSPHVQQRGELREASEARSRVVSSRGSRSSDRGAWKERELAHGRIVLVTVAVVLPLAPLPVHGQKVESVGGGHRRGRSLPVCGRGLLTATALDAYALILEETGLYPRIDAGLAVTGRGLLTATDHVDSVRVPQLAGEITVTARGHAISHIDRDRLPSSADRSRSREKGRRARRDQQEGVETVEVSQAPAVSEAPAGATPVAGGASLTALPSAVQDLARFILSLSGSSSLGAVGGVAGVAASAVGSGVQLCPSTSAGGAVTLGAATAIPAGAGDLPAASAAVPGVSGHQQRQEDARSRRRRCRSSSDGTDRRSKKRPRGRSPPGPSSRRRERHYRASSSSSEEDRADASPPRAGRAPGGTPGDYRSA